MIWRMTGFRRLVVELELIVGEETPIEGWARASGLPASRFSGWSELFAALQTLACGREAFQQRAAPHKQRAVSMGPSGMNNHAEPATGCLPRPGDYRWDGCAARPPVTFHWLIQASAPVMV